MFQSGGFGGWRTAPHLISNYLVVTRLEKLITYKLNIILNMGYNKPRTPFRRLTNQEILDLFNAFYWWRLINRVYWKNYVIDDHTRVIIEMTRNPLMFARHLFRSVQGFGDPEEIEATNFTEYWVASMNRKTKTVEILKHSPPDNYQEIRHLYLQHKGTGNWCK